MQTGKSELIEVYDLEERLVEIKEREIYYAQIKDEFKRTGKITTQVKRIVALVMNPTGRIYLQKRSKQKEANSGLYDKTIAGHVTARTSYDVMLVQECAEELGFPVACVPVTEFRDAVRNIPLEIVGIFKQIDYVAPYYSTRIYRDGFQLVQPFMTKIYIGYYNGGIRFSATESSGIEVFSLEDLKEEIRNQSGKFTPDLKYMIEQYGNHLIPL